MSRISPVLLSGKTAAPRELSIATVNQWMGDLRGIPYGYHLEWKTPSEVESGQPADCKGKAVALYEKMQARGATTWMACRAESISGGSYLPLYAYAGTKKYRAASDSHPYAKN